MYTEIELSDTKYRDLLKIAKKFGIKGGRQKTEKLISLILSGQKDENVCDSSGITDGEMLEDIEFPGSGFDLSSENLDSENQYKQLPEKKKTLRKTRKSVRLQTEKEEPIPQLRQSKGFQLNKASKRPDSKMDLVDSNIPVLNHKKKSSGSFTCSGTFEVPSSEDQKLSPKKKLTRSGTFDFSDKEDKPIKPAFNRSGTFEISTNKANSTPQKRLTRSGTFEISDAKKDSNRLSCHTVFSSPTIPKSSNSPRRRLTRSATFELSSDDASSDNTSSDKTRKISVNSNKRKRSSQSNEKISCLKKKSNDDIDLSCKEIQTAEDIKNIEESRAISLSPPSVNETSPSFAQRSLKRRSLRSKLLDSKFSTKKQKVSVCVSTTPPVNNSSSNNSTTTDSENEESKKRRPHDRTGIPRFVAYARKKVPDFSKIHEQAFNKMESIDDYMTRKHTLSAKVESRFKPSVISTKKINYNFAAGKNSPIIFGKMNTPERRSQHGVSSPSVRSKSPHTLVKVKEAKCEKIDDKENITLKKSKNSNVPVPLPSKKSATALHTRKENKLPVGSPRNSSSLLPGRPSTPGSLQRRKEYDATLNKSRTGRNVDKKAPVKTARDREVLKKLVSKNPRVKSSADLKNSQKSFLKGVRLNKRFELQMAKRGIKI